VKSLVRRLLISVTIGALMLYLACREIELEGVWNALLEARWGVLLPYFGCMAVQHLFRSWRWGQLLAPIHPVPFKRILPISSVGFFAILALPLRMGEFVRPYLIADPPHLRMSHGLGTMAVERVFDGLFLSCSAFVAVAAARAQGLTVPTWVFASGLVALGLFVAALVVLLMAMWQRERAVSACRRLFGLISPKLAAKAGRAAEGVVDGFRAIPSVRRMLLFAGATAAYWFFNAVALWVLSRGFALDLTLATSAALIALIGIGIMIPAGPGFVGNYELFAEGALSMYLPKAVLARSGGAFIIASHATNALWYVATGALAMASSHVSFGRMLQAPTEASQVASTDP
jgi:uncharacterized protein (TIRG00374 family)